jgi:uncharacterized membrane protein
MIAGSIIPVIGAIIQLVISGPIMGGLWMLYVKTIRNEEPRFGDAFSGFGPRFGSLLGAYLVPSVLAGLCMAPFLIAMAVLFIIPAAAAGQSGGTPNIGAVSFVILIATGLPAFLAMIYLSIAWLFALPLVADKGLGFWAAMNLSRRMVNKHFWTTLLLMIVCWLIAVVSFLACGIGFLVGGPVAALTVAWHYQRTFGELAPESH